MPDLLLELIRTEKVTFTHCVPTILRMLLRNPGAERYALSGITMLIVGEVPADGASAVRDTDSYLRITDRLKDVVKVAGEWVSSLELEDLIAQHPAVGAIDKTSVGKTNKAELRAKHL